MGFIKEKQKESSIYVAIGKEATIVRPLWPRPISYWQHWIAKVIVERGHKADTLRSGGSEPCSGRPDDFLCNTPDPLWDHLQARDKFTQKGHRKDFARSLQHGLPVWDYKAEQVRMLSQGNQLFEAFDSAEDAGLDITQWDWAVWKSEEQKTTKYHAERTNQGPMAIQVPPAMVEAVVAAFNKDNVTCDTIENLKMRIAADSSGPWDQGAHAGMPGLGSPPPMGLPSGMPPGGFPGYPPPQQQSLAPPAQTGYQQPQVPPWQQPQQVQPPAQPWQQTQVQPPFGQPQWPGAQQNPGLPQPGLPFQGQAQQPPPFQPPPETQSAPQQNMPPMYHAPQLHHQQAQMPAQQAPVQAPPVAPQPAQNQREYDLALQIPSGKYQGRSLGWLQENDSNYFTGLGSFMKNHPDILAARDRLKSSYPVVPSAAPQQPIQPQQPPAVTQPFPQQPQGPQTMGQAIQQALAGQQSPTQPQQPPIVPVQPQVQPTMPLPPPNQVMPPPYLPPSVPTQAQQQAPTNGHSGNGHAVPNRDQIEAEVNSMIMGRRDIWMRGGAAGVQALAEFATRSIGTVAYNTAPAEQLLKFKADLEAYHAAHPPQA